MPNQSSPNMIIDGLTTLRPGWAVSHRKGSSLVTIGTRYVKVTNDDGQYALAEADAAGLEQGVTQHFQALSSTDLARAIEEVLS